MLTEDINFYNKNYGSVGLIIDSYKLENWVVFKAGLLITISPQTSWFGQRITFKDIPYENFGQLCGKKIFWKTFE